ncbi:hypothetical protein P43SY_011225 [Pythium insidiosum]|uniref:FCP1 homology domain-containing protein n=1 Tax=Pythium insidiosum TaxID=114742 RepID=A0AAD5Q1M6_PYTIN|nr:hypothetical protein P43SY_011225 [Pythium insidiosum]
MPSAATTAASPAPAPNAVRYAIPNGDFCSYLKGCWKRNLEWRHFGASFKLLRSTNNVVFIEEDPDAARQPNTQFLKWSFGRSHKKQDLVSAYTIQVGRDVRCALRVSVSHFGVVFDGHQFIPDEEGTFMEWSFEGVTCHGVFKPEASVAIFNFCLQESMVTITYRILDANTMAVCIVDVDSEHTPTIQYGNIGGRDVQLEWMPYGVAADVSAWRREMIEARASVRPQLVVLLVRVCDLEAAHPELLGGARGAQDAVAEFLAQLRVYNASAEDSTAPSRLPHVVVSLCPSRPSSEESETSWHAMESAIETAAASMRHVDCVPSKVLLDWFSDPPPQATSSWYDALLDKRQHSPFTTAMCRVLALSTARQIARLIRSRCNFPTKKVIVLDCDNTLWGGAVADVGPLGVSLSHRFLSLQRFVMRQQQERGMLLCLASKNIAQDVEAVFAQRKDEMVLQLEQHIVSQRVNWRRKSESLEGMANELGLGLDSFIFIDDNAVECNEVTTALPMVSVIHFNPPESEESAAFLEREWIFDLAFAADAPTAEDTARTQMYQQNQQRAALQSASSSQTAFLSSLGIRINFERLTKDHETTNPSTWDRVLQLHQRTNTFNIATSFSRTVTRDVLTHHTAAPQFSLCAHVTDRFGHYGLVCVALCRIVSESTLLKGASSIVKVESFLLSCRALNRGVEHAMVKRIAEVARESDCSEISFAWEPTVRNEPARCFFGAWSAAKFASDSSLGSFVTEREAKLKRSAIESGNWVVQTADALELSFLREIECAEGTEQQHQQTSWSALPFVRMTWLSLAQWAPSFFVTRVLKIFPRWLMRSSLYVWWSHAWTRLGAVLLPWERVRSPASNLRLLHASAQPGLLMHAMHTLPDLTRFLSEVDPDVGQTMDSNRDSAELDDFPTDEAFRMNAREQTKRVLLEHVSDDNVRVVWSPNRDFEDGSSTTEA